MQRCHALPVPPEPYGKGGTNHAAVARIDPRDFRPNEMTRTSQFRTASCRAVALAKEDRFLVVLLALFVPAFFAPTATAGERSVTAAEANGTYRDVEGKSEIKILALGHGKLKVKLALVYESNREKAEWQISATRQAKRGSRTISLCSCRKKQVTAKSR